jgi:hypothetical protein
MTKSYGSIRFMFFNAFLTVFQLYRGGQFYWWRKPEYPQKITDLPKLFKLVALKLYTQSEAE